RVAPACRSMTSVLSTGMCSPLSIVLVIIALIAGAAITAGTTRLKTAKLNQTNLKLDKIEEALGAYLILNGRLPCPADGTLALTAAPSAPNATFPNGNGGFGREWRNAGNTDCNAGLAPTGGGGNIFVGVVPAISLNLPDEFVFDGWGRRITYAVHRDYARDRATFLAPPTAPPLITVTDTAVVPNIRTNQAVIVMVSHGEDGEGAWAQGGGAVRFSPSGAIAAPQLENAHTVNNFNSFNTTFVQGSPQAAPVFDDILRYKLKWQMIRLAGGIVDVNMCDLARRTMQALNEGIAPKQGPVGCLRPAANDCTGAGCAVNNPLMPNTECIIRQQQLAAQIIALCFN
ncbi:MAG: hypothetical protein J0L97_01420, partial [Alphaproteobacteria bacterium]|nr:hypothetical protein [Alphaproteobacteria bacterium]